MANLRALVCDDEAPLRDLMARRVEKLGLEVERAESGKDAVERINATHYDLLITDIYMPDVTGLELLQQMKALDPHAQVVVVTASATLDNAVGALNHGAFAYLTKPFDHLTVFDNVVSRAIELRRALLDNLRMGEVQRRRGDLLEEEITGRILQVKRAQQYLVGLLDCLPLGVAVVNPVGRVDLINSRAEDALEPVLAAGPDALRNLLAGIPVLDGRQQGEIELGGRRLELLLTDLAVADEEPQRILVLREPEAAGPAMGTIVSQMLVNLRSGLSWLDRREKDQGTRKVLRGMASELMSMATFLDIHLPDEGALEEQEDPAAVAPAPVQAEAPSQPPMDAAPAVPDNGRSVPPVGRGRRPPTEPLPERTGSLMLRKGMTMVLEGQLRKKRAYGEPKTRPEEAERMQKKIDRWARSRGGPPEGEDEGEAQPNSPTAWPPPLPSSSGKS